MDLFAKCQRVEKLKQLQAIGCYPFFIPIQSTAGPDVIINGRQMIMLGSNNYLGLTQHPGVQQAAVRAIEQYGTGCTGSRVMNGTCDLHLELESRLAAFARKQSALVFTTGYQVNLGVISALVGRHDTVVIDKADHASIIDGCRLSMGKVVRYRHNDMQDLERALSSLDERHGILLVVDGAFSMEGDIVDLPEIVRLKNKYGARLVVDEAHSVGVFGEGGRGVSEHFNLLDEVDLIVGTFSKSFASTGGFVAGDADVVYYIQHFARPLLFTAAIPPASAGAALAALSIIENEPERRDLLWKHTRKMKSTLSELGFNTGNSASPIIPIIVGDEMKLAFFWRGLFEGGVFTNAAASPAVEPDRALIRTSYMATHTDDHLDQALEIIHHVGRETGVI